MSEYQYYEFAALDRRLSPAEQAELRHSSSRARVTANSFANEYHWGDFNGDVEAWMERYFNIHVYVANWGTHRLMLRLPRSHLPAELFEYAQHGIGQYDDSAFSAHLVGEDCILTWEFSDDTGETSFEEEERGSSWLAMLQALRTELHRGDTRALYLGWLARVAHQEIADDAEEPPLPAGLQRLTPAQQALAEFLLLDPEWLRAAAAGSLLPSDETDAESSEAERLEAWLAQATPALLQQAARLLLQGDTHAAEHLLQGAHNDWLRSHAGEPATAHHRRRVRDIAKSARDGEH